MPEAEPVELIIFDCDGVLVDTESVGAAAVAKELQAWGLPPLGAQGWQPGEALSQALDRIRTNHPIPPNAEALLRAQMHASFQSSSITVPGMLKLVSRIGVPWAIASNGPEEKMRLTLKLAGYTTLEHFCWNRVFSGSALGLLKPNPDLFFHVAHELRTRRERCLVIEDSPLGLAAAKSAGMRVVHFLQAGQTGTNHADPASLVDPFKWVAHDVKELETFFRRLELVS